MNKLKNESKFSELAKAHSIGPSAKNDGQLGWFQSGQMVEAFEKATFALEKGKITKVPVKTKFGYHVIMLNDVRNSKPKPLNTIKKCHRSPVLSFFSPEPCAAPSGVFF